MTVAECQARVDSVEFVEWLAFMELSPVGELRADLRMSQTIAETWRAAGLSDAKPEHFPLHVPAEPEAPLTPAENAARIKGKLLMFSR